MITRGMTTDNVFSLPCLYVCARPVLLAQDGLVFVPSFGVGTMLASPLVCIIGFVLRGRRVRSEPLLPSLHLSETLPAGIFSGKISPFSPPSLPPLCVCVCVGGGPNADQAIPIPAANITIATQTPPAPAHAHSWTRTSTPSVTQCNVMTLAFVCLVFSQHRNTGFMWNISNVLSIVAIPQIGYAIAYPFLQCALLVGGLWGVFVFREILGPAVKVFFCSGVVLIVGAVALALAASPG